MSRSLYLLMVVAPLLTGCPSDIEPGIRNSDPRAEITSHSDGDDPEAGYRTFSGTVEDPDHQVEDLELVWLYDGAEACPPITPDTSGNTTCEIFLDSGDHIVSLQVEDPLGGIGSDKVSLDVQPYGDPWAELTSPVGGSVYYSDQLIEFSATVGDESDEPGDLVAAWESSIEGELDLDADPDTSGGISDFGYLTEGEHALTLTVTNTGGNQTSESVVIDVGPPNSAPTCSITVPLTGAEYEYGEVITFEGLALDVDVPSDWLTATWESLQHGHLAEQAPLTDGTFTLSVDDLPVDVHNITLTVSDDQDATCSAGIVVTVMDCPTIWHADDDGDGFGDPDSTTTGCDQPTGYVDDDSDCDDLDAAVHPDATEICNAIDDNCDGDVDDDDATLDTSTADTWYADSDGDSYGDAASSTLACDQPSGYLADTTDCDDADATAYPGAAELCDSADNDCDGTVDEDDAVDASTWYADSDADGFGDAGSTTAACSVPSGYTGDTSDCDDGDSAINPDADELCDGADNDCDGDTDEDSATDASTWYADADSDGYGDVGTTTAACSVPSGYLADDTDCDDTRLGVNPSEDESCNGRDDDCDGDVDEASAVDASTWYQDRDSDGYGDDATTTLSCSTPTGYVALGGDCDDGDAAYNPGASETDCTDPADYNCDGSTAYSDGDGDGYAACEECDDTDAAVSPVGTELCDGIDNDCDGTVDEDDATDASTWYADLDADGFGDASSTAVSCSAPRGHVADSTDCDDADTSAFPGAPEACDGVDNDCDGTVDEDDATDASTWYADADGDGYGDASSTTAACSAPTGYGSDAADCDDSDAGAYPGADEYCDSVDNDCDGTVDEDDAVDATTWHLDADSDGYGGSLYDVTACSQPSGFVADATDCLDSSASTYPGAPEYCNGSDDDCDGTVDEDDAVDATTWYADADSDSYGDAGSTTAACSVPSGYVAGSTDCDDADADANPAADEYCDGHDDDCDGDVDEDDAVDAVTWYLDGDGDGYGLDTSTIDACDLPTGYAIYSGDCDDADTAYNPGAAEDDCTDPADYNCDGSTAYTDSDGDGWAACEECDDLDPSVYPGASETWYDGVDGDCDGLSDYDADLDGYDADAYGGADCDDVDASINPDASETWYDGVDGDCDGLSDYDADLDGYDADAHAGADCNDTDASINPDASESWYDGVDADCDGLSDYDADVDGYDSDAYGGADCDDAVAAVNPAASETWYDGVDGDCDGLSDYDADLDGYDSAAYSGNDCDDTDPYRALYCSDGVADWTELDVLPQALSSTAAVLDPGNLRVLVYGGQSYHEVSDVLYEYDLSTTSWAALSPGGVDPGARLAASAVFDEADSRLWFFGGQEYHALSDEVFVLDAATVGSETWTLLSASYTSPDPRLGAATVLDIAGDRMLVIGGQGYHGLLDDVWALDLTTTSAASWTELSPSGAAPERAFAAAVYDPNYDAVYLLGGETYHALADDPQCLDLSGSTPTWSSLTTSGDTLPPLAGASAVWADDFGGALVHGGATYHQLSSTSYLLQPTGSCQVEVTALTISGDDPGAVVNASMVWNPSDATGLLLGGESYYRLNDDVTEVVP